MSKATFYEHFANKEECILALFDEAATEVTRALVNASADEASSYEERVRGGIHAFLDTLAATPTPRRRCWSRSSARGPAPPSAATRSSTCSPTACCATTRAWRSASAAPRFASKDDAFAIIGAIVELVSRQLRTGVPARLADLEPVIQRLILGMLAAPR